MMLFVHLLLLLSALQHPLEDDFLVKLNPLFVVVHSFSCLSMHSFSTDFFELIAAVCALIE